MPTASSESVQVPPQIGAMLTQLADTADLDAALRRVITDYLSLKLNALHTERAQFEAKWGMTFNEFVSRRDNNELSLDAYSYDVEQDFWAWEQTITLLEYYGALQAKYIL